MQASWTIDGQIPYDPMEDPDYIAANQARESALQRADERISKPKRRKGNHGSGKSSLESTIKETDERSPLLGNTHL